MSVVAKPEVTRCDWAASTSQSVGSFPSPSSAITLQGHQNSSNSYQLHDKRPANTPSMLHGFPTKDSWLCPWCSQSHPSQTKGLKCVLMLQTLPYYPLVAYGVLSYNPEVQDDSNILIVKKYIYSIYVDIFCSINMKISTVASSRNVSSLKYA